jgi:beta-xylosidase
MPRDARAQPSNYLVPQLGTNSDLSTVDPTALYPFGHGLSYTSFTWESVLVDGRAVEPGERVVTGTDGSVTVSVLVRNTGDCAGSEVVQLYLHDPVAQVTRPVVRLIGYAKIPLALGESCRVTFTVHADLAAFTGRRGTVIVEPGELDLLLSTSSTHPRHAVGLRLVGDERELDHHRHLTAGVTLS